MKNLIVTYLIAFLMALMSAACGKISQSAPEANVGVSPGQGNSAWGAPLNVNGSQVFSQTSCTLTVGPTNYSYNVTESYSGNISIQCGDGTLSQSETNPTNGLCPLSSGVSMQYEGQDPELYVPGSAYAQNLNCSIKYYRLN